MGAGRTGLTRPVWGPCMLKLIDRQMVRGYFKSYTVCLSSLLSLYVVVDLFTNLDDFTHHGQGLSATVRHIVTYYGYKIPKIFDHLCEVIALLAAMFTVAWMQRNNEQVPLLSAGVSTRRIVAPVLACACVMLSLAGINQEFLIPRVADQLSHDRDDPSGAREVTARSHYEPNNIHIEAEKAIRKGRIVRDFRVTIPETLAGQLLHLTAREARYLPERKAWELVGTRPAEADPIENVLEKVDTGRYLLHVREVDFEALTRNPNWFLLTSTQQLFEELQKPESNRLSAMAVLFHMRLTRPLLGILLVFLGLSVILRDQNRNAIVSSGLCLVLCGLFFGVQYSCKMLGDNDFLPPALAAWAPVLCFGPLAVTMFDAVHT
jgi:lipopolysaccharide export system permease protein